MIRGGRNEDDNRERRMEVIRKLTGLLDLASRPGYWGKIAVEIGSENGQLGRVKIIREETSG